VFESPEIETKTAQRKRQPAIFIFRGFICSFEEADIFILACARTQYGIAPRGAETSPSRRLRFPAPKCIVRIFLRPALRDSLRAEPHETADHAPNLCGLEARNVCRGMLRFTHFEIGLFLTTYINLGYNGSVLEPKNDA
jgi:hypothetical protein